MKKLFCLILLACLVIACDEDHKNGPRFLEGQEIPNTNNCLNPALSPDGKYLAVNYQPPSKPDSGGIYILNLTTSHLQFLIGGSAPDWSPDGEWIAFIGGGPHIYKIKTNGDSLTQLTFDGRNFFPDWSPDGNKIAYDRSLPDQSGPAGVWTMLSDGSQRTPVFGGVEPDWHPFDNIIIAVVGVSSTTVWKKFVRYSVGSKIVIDSLDAVIEGNNFSPQYSPDGSRIAFYNDEGIWVMNSDGTNPKRIVPTHEEEILKFKLKDWVSGIDLYQGPPLLIAQVPAWSPDGQHIVYQHFQVEGRECTPDGCGFLFGKSSLYMVHIDSALAVSNL